MLPISKNIDLFKMRVSKLGYQSIFLNLKNFQLFVFWGRYLCHAPLRGIESRPCGRKCL